MSDTLFAACCLGSETQHALWEGCPQDLVAAIVVEAEAVLALTQAIDARRQTFAAEMAVHIAKMSCLAATLARSREDG